MIRTGFIPRDKGGIYRVTCIPIGMSYIGATSGFRVRWFHHRTLLRRGDHYNPTMQSDWDRFGEEAFEFVVLETIQPGTSRREWIMLDERELYWVAHYRTQRQCYNILPVGHCPKGHKRRAARARQESQDE